MFFNIIKEIRSPISKEMLIFEEKFQKLVKSNISLIDKVIHYIIVRKGKQIRPMFIFLVAKMLGNVSKKTYHTALLIELIHNGTLIHDDIIDNSNIRRGFLSIHAMWKNKIAVLIGDYFLSKSMLLAINNDYYDLLKIISNTIKEMSEGELLQIEKSKMLNINENIYNKIIYSKTASLISACCEAGAASVGANKKSINQMQKFGELLGMAFQIKDDLLDYEDNNLTGKPSYIDIKERKITLPLIYTIENSSIKEKEWIIDIIKNHNKNKLKINQLIDHVKKTGGINYANDKIKLLKNNALKILNKYPKSKTKKSLETMIYYIINRNQ